MHITIFFLNFVITTEIIDIPAAVDNICLDEKNSQHSLLFYTRNIKWCRNNKWCTKTTRPLKLMALTFRHFCLDMHFILLFFEQFGAFLPKGKYYRAVIMKISRFRISNVIYFILTATSGTATTSKNWDTQRTKCLNAITLNKLSALLTPTAFKQKINKQNLCLQYFNSVATMHLINVRCDV